MFTLDEKELSRLARGECASLQGEESGHTQWCDVLGHSKPSRVGGAQHPGVRTAYAGGLTPGGKDGKEVISNNLDHIPNTF